MSAADELMSLIESSNSPKPCAVGKWLKTQPTEIVEVVELLKAAKKVKRTEALNILHNYYDDLPFARTTFSAHLRGECPCKAN